ncbi:MAG TPA: FAD:protein FMN transferase, partial [Candidatus Eisenbacteria bacterium]
MKFVLALLLLLLPAAAAAKSAPVPNRGAAPPLATIERARYIGGAHCIALVQGRGDSAATEAAADEALDGIARLQDAVDLAHAGSELSRLNAAASSERVTCSPELYAAIDEAMEVADATGGVWDPTIEPLTRAWDVRGDG